mgnify:CR=1 FL=1
MSFTAENSQTVSSRRTRLPWFQATLTTLTFFAGGDRRVARLRRLLHHVRRNSADNLQARHLPFRARRIRGGEEGGGESEATVEAYLAWPAEGEPVVELGAWAADFREQDLETLATGLLGCALVYPESVMNEQSMFLEDLATDLTKMAEQATQNPTTVGLPGSSPFGFCRGFI